MEGDLDAVSILFVKQYVPNAKKYEKDVQEAQLKNGVHIKKLHQKKETDHSKHSE
jgi:hypothetical protein